ncbi:MAG: ABC transporter substrate-binding protein/permease [Candidatus Berkiella sp.]
MFDSMCWSNNLKKLFILIFTLLSVMACEQHTQEKITLGTSADYPPFEHIQEGKIVGLDIDVAQFIAKRLNKELVIQDMDFGGLIPALNSGKVDFVMAGLSISEERKKNVDFTLAYFEPQFTLLTLKDKPISDLNHLADKKIGVQLGSVMESFLKDLQEKLPTLTLESLPKNIPLIQNLKLGRLDGVMVEDAQANAFVAANPGLIANNLPGSQGEYAIALSKNSHWLSDFNIAINDLKQSGELERIKQKWIENQDNKQHTNSYGWVLYIIKGLGVTLEFTIISVLCGLVIGVILALANLSNRCLFQTPAKFYISIFRGTPLLLQLSFVYFATPSLTGYNISIFLAGVTAFSLNSGAYIAEIIRAGIQSVDKGQFEASQALGVPYTLMIKDIILPQSFRNILPALVNEMVNMLKESAIISTIGAADLMKRAQVVSAEQYTYFAPLLVAAGCYYITVFILSHFATRLENKLSLAHHD